MFIFLRIVNFYHILILITTYKDKYHSAKASIIFFAMLGPTFLDKLDVTCDADPVRNPGCARIGFLEPSKCSAIHHAIFNDIPGIFDKNADIAQT
jgi:hypothetical protein